VYKGNNKLETTKERVGKKGYAVGIENLISFVNEQLPQFEQIGEVYREDGRVYPPLAVRELIVNSLIHQNFSATGTGPMIEIYDNRIEITNPGKPLIEILRLIDHNPVSRNEKLARMMRRMNICEERGSGIDKVVLKCEIALLPAPSFHATDDFTRAVLYGPKTMRDMGREEKILATYMHACIKFVSGQVMTNQTIRQRFGIEESNYPFASRIIKMTSEAKLIKEKEKGSKGYVPYWA
jgi:predicted HTH transcriptional regulator